MEPQPLPSWPLRLAARRRACVDTMAAVPLERIGRITAGPAAGQYVLVRDDQGRTGDFLVFQSAAPDVFSAPEVFNAWVGRRDALPAFFDEAAWQVEWLPGDA